MPFPLSLPFALPSISVDPAVAAAYARQLQLLLPPGTAFDLEEDSEISATLAAFAMELARVDARGVDLINETDPRSVNETITDWEKMLQLPDDRVTAIPATLAERRIAITQKYVSRGGQDPAFFVALCALCGYDLAGGSLPTPVPVGANWNNTAGGSLHSGTYSYKVTAFNDQGETLASAAMTATVASGTTNVNLIEWAAVKGASGYRLYGRTSGSEHLIGTYYDTGAADYFANDDGSVTPTGAPPIANTATYPAIERFATKIRRVHVHRIGHRYYGPAWAYAMRLNIQPTSGTVLAQADFERVIRHVTHSHITDVFVYH